LTEQKFYLEAVSQKESRLNLYQVPAAGRPLERTLRPKRIATLRGWRLRVAHGAIARATGGANRGEGILRTRRTKTTSIKEEDGIRLGLIFIGLRDMKDVLKAHELVSGVQEMSREESYYWYAKILNGSPNRGLRALRVLLSGVK
jgi:hypothetical protein